MLASIIQDRVEICETTHTSNKNVVRVSSFTRSFQRQPALMPTVRAASENSDILDTSGRQVRCRTRRAPIGLAHHYDRLFASGQIGGSVSQFGERNIDRTRQVSGGAVNSSGWR